LKIRAGSAPGEEEVGGAHRRLRWARGRGRLPEVVVEEINSCGRGRGGGEGGGGGVLRRG
jgi:hypothetical protein